MTAKVRRIVIAGALLLTLSATLAIRLNIESINNHVRQEMESYIDAGLEAGSATLSFMHGIGLRLDQVSLKQEHYQVYAGHMNIGIRLLPLLLGKIEVDTLDIHDSVILVQPEALQPTSNSISSLPFERINLIRSQIQTFDQAELLNNLHLELRNIGPNRETLWEIQAKQEGHSISGHGRLNFYNGEISSGFGKLKLDRVPVAPLRPVTPEALYSWFEGSEGMLSGSLTLDITRNQTWAVFGELSLQEKQNEAPLRLRGKLEHQETGVLLWRDSFIHFNEAAVIAINGECRQEKCETGLDASNIELETWFPLMPESVSFHKQIGGLTDINAFVQWDDKGWDSSAAFRLKEAYFRHHDEEYPLPEIEMQSEELRGDSKTWFAKVLLTSPQTKGEMTVESQQMSSGNKEMNIHAFDVNAALWRPLANLLLSSLNIDPQLGADGLISGSIQLQQHISGKILRLDLDGKQASLFYPELFKKPENIDAACNVELRWPTADSVPDVLTLRECRLDNSSLDVARWVRAGDHSVEVEGVHIHFDQLNAHSVVLPADFAALRGTLEGDGRTSWPEQESFVIYAPRHINGIWKLQEFGTEAWQLSGQLRATNGLVRSDKMMLKSAHGIGELNGELHFGKASGDVDVLSADFNLGSYPALPSFFDDKNIRGRIHQGSITIAGNRLNKLHGYYRVNRGKVDLENIQATIAEGDFNSEKLSIAPAPGSYAIAGQLRLKNLNLEQLVGAAALLQANVKGRVHANVELSGTLPQLQSGSWLQSNGDILIYNGEWSRQSKAATLSEHLGIRKPELLSYTFNKLGLRFRINEQQTEISNLIFNLNGSSLRGKAEISADGTISGTLQSSDTKENYAIAGEWPLPVWESLQ